ncbi:MAG: NAD-dependent epimerase/dehydratase family protein, partial [Alphaproteobacteria bacterium]|nr:NAD-dependent epimerase/dehydratase family protein [Alphaproteobacteria bacterium]
MSILVTGAGLIGTAFARDAIDRGEQVSFFDPEPREDYIRFRLEGRPFRLVRGDVRDLPGLLAAAKETRAQCIVHTAGLIGGNVQQSLSTGFDINLMGTRNVAETVRLADVRRLVHISTMGVYDSRRKPEGAVPEDFPRGARRA